MNTKKKQLIELKAIRGENSGTDSLELASSFPPSFPLIPNSSLLAFLRPLCNSICVRSLVHEVSGFVEVLQYPRFSSLWAQQRHGLLGERSETRPWRQQIVGKALLKPTVDPRDTWMLSYISVPGIADSQRTRRKLSQWDEPHLPMKL